MQAQLRELGCLVRLKHFPPYTLELNPAEGQWRITKVTANNVRGRRVDEKVDT